MRILEALGNPVDYGGVEMMVLNSLSAMDYSDLEIDCFTPYSCENIASRCLLNELGVKIHELGIPFSTGISIIRIIRPFRQFLHQNRYDVIHIHSGSIFALAAMAAEAHKAGIKKVIVHAHSTGYHHSMKRRIKRRLAALVMSYSADVYCACSKAAADWMFVPEYARNAILISNGINLERFVYNPVIRNQMRKKLGLEDKFVIGHTGRFAVEKNHPFLIRVFEKVIEKDNNCHLLLLGDGEDRAIIERLIEEKDLTSFVTLTGNVDNEMVPNYLQAMDVFILPSLFEGLPIVAIEAQAAGLPVVLSDTVTKETRVTDEVSFLSLNDDLSVWADEILRHRNMKRTDNRTKLVEAGYSIEQTAEQMRRLYLE